MPLNLVPIERIDSPANRVLPFSEILQADFQSIAVPDDLGVPNVYTPPVLIEDLDRIKDGFHALIEC
jgi:hypothetical protein